MGGGRREEEGRGKEEGGGRREEGEGRKEEGGRRKEEGGRRKMGFKMMAGEGEEGGKWGKMLRSDEGEN